MGESGGIESKRSSGGSIHGTGTPGVQGIVRRAVCPTPKDGPSRKGQRRTDRGCCEDQWGQVTTTCEACGAGGSEAERCWGRAAVGHVPPPRGWMEATSGSPRGADTEVAGPEGIARRQHLGEERCEGRGPGAGPPEHGCPVRASDPPAMTHVLPQPASGPTAPGAGGARRCGLSEGGTRLPINLSTTSSHHRTR